MNHGSTSYERLLDLLADRAAGLLDDAGRRELDALLALHPEADDDSMEHAAAAATVALVGDREPMPAGLQSRLLAALREAEDSPPLQLTEAPSRERAKGTAVLAWGGWFVAAACLAFAAFIAISRSPQAKSPVEARQEFLQSAADIRVATWNDWNDPEQKGVTGEVAWSETSQKGYMAFKGLALNDPSREQYQLWIIDERGLEQRISGGVFNAVPETGEMVVEIDPAVRVRQAQAFAITIERPGGVWVSDMNRRVVIASLK